MESANTGLWFKDFGYYVKWFAIWGALLAALQPVTSEQTARADFWAAKAQQALLGAVFGIVCAVAFAALQNGVNASRRKWLSWLLALGTWLGVGLVLAFATGRLG